MFGRILVPFDDLLHLQETLCQALELAENLAAEVVLLRVNLPESDSSDCFDKECLYSELKALQVQSASLPVPVRIEAMAGPVNEAIVRYAAEHGISLIFSPEIARLVNQKTGSQKTPALAARAAPGYGVSSLTDKVFSRPVQGVAGAS